MKAEDVKIKEYKHKYPDIPDRFIIQDKKDIIDLVYPKVMDNYYGTKRNQRYVPPTKDGIRIMITELSNVFKEILLKDGTILIPGILEISLVPKKQYVIAYKSHKIFNVPKVRYLPGFRKALRWKKKKELLMQLTEDELVIRQKLSENFKKRVLNLKNQNDATTI